ncbi:hypothetical protein [Halococcus saccharolyticus]|uniref:Uncharacterized protein n=1 Tax=Halococcus saccharolyticus DSM 5350 TaxID=1227455 RepID=M0MIF6_9EURY|nr:hypothetical protein [Halococcus saccharolyticus]EMA45466.1 hypothetical protein C449_07595 [Halococcus saccharolyticus DSM 5350]
MVEWSPVVSGIGVALAAAVLGLTIPLPEALWPVAIGAVLATGFGCGLVAGRRSEGRWRARARTGSLAGALGGTVLATVLWASMGRAVPRAEDSTFWAINDVIAANTIGIERVPWLYTGNTLFGPLLIFVVCLFAVEGWIAGGVTSGTLDRSPARSR